jgi:quinol monooxygenase YgiN
MADGTRFNNARTKTGGAVCVVMRAETNPGEDEEFEALMSDLAYSVRSDETGCRSYVVTRELGSRAHFAIHARFANWQSFERHADTPHMTRALPRLSARLAAPLSMEIFMEV